MFLHNVTSRFTSNRNADTTGAILSFDFNNQSAESVDTYQVFDNNYNSDYNRFLVHYIDVEQLMVSSSYERKINDIMSLNLKTVYYNWGDAEIAHKSNLLVNASLFINLRDKIILNPKLEYISNQKAFISEEYEIDYKFHFHLDIVYNYSKVFSAYLQLNNLTNSKKELWRLC